LKINFDIFVILVSPTENDQNIYPNICIQWHVLFTTVPFHKPGSAQDSRMKEAYMFF